VQRLKEITCCFSPDYSVQSRPFFNFRETWRRRGNSSWAFPA